MAKPLSERLASASASDRISTTNLAQLIADATAERDAQAALHISLSADAVDFRLAEVDRDSASQNAERASRNAAMLDTAIRELEPRLQARRESDKQASAEAERKAILAERDALAERIRTEWPILSEGMISLFEAIQSSDARMKAAGLYDIGAEALARGCDGLHRFGISQARRLIEARLPDFESAGDAWPRPRPNYDMRAEVARQGAVIDAQIAANAPVYIWHHAKVTNGVGNAYRGQFRDGSSGIGQISNGETDIQITVQEAERLNCIPGIKVARLDKAPEAPATYFNHPAAA